MKSTDMQGKPTEVSFRRLVKLLAAGLGISIGLFLALGVGVSIYAHFHPDWEEQGEQQDALERAHQVRQDAVDKLCESYAESEFVGRPVQVSFDYSPNFSDDHSSLYWGFDAETLNRYDIAVKYRGVCVADSDGRGGAKVHISMLKQVIK